MTTTELSQAVESVAFMIRGEPRAVELRCLHGLLDMLTEWESTHPKEADAERWSPRSTTSSRRWS
jgi:hypothetical protein